MNAELEREEGLVKEALNIFRVAQEKAITLRLLGGIAFRVRCPSSSNEKLKRSYQDIDFFGLTKDRGRIRKLFSSFGYVEPRTLINILQEHRMIVENSQNNTKVDIFLDVFEMSHKLKFTERTTLDEPTLPLADLLLTKLQAFEFTQREYKDVFALLKDYDLTRSEEKNGINAAYIAKLCGNDWGLSKTVLVNLGRVMRSISSYLPAIEDQTIVFGRISQLKDILEREPKSVKWKMRAIIGQRLRWYEIPEEIKRIPGPF